METINIGRMSDLDVEIPGIEDGIWNIAEVIECRALRQPAALAVILPDRVLSYRELVKAIHVVARKLLDSGAQPGQTFGVSMGQTMLHLVTLLALARIGAIGIALHQALPPERRALVARRFNITAVLSGRADMQLDGWPFISLSGIDLAATVAPMPASGLQADDPCWIMLSSGTTGDPKGVLRSHGYMLDRVVKSTYIRTPQSRLLPMDLNFGVGFGQALRMLVLGGTIVLSPDMLPANLAYMVRSHAVTHWLLSPSMAEDILVLLEDDDIHFPSLAYLQIVGATPSRRLLDILFRRFTPNIYVCYGTSEIGSIAVADPDILRRAPDSVGTVAPWMQLELVDQQDRPVPVGQSGRMRVRLDHMFDAYYRDPILTSSRFRDGWYYTEDRARLDAQGLLYIDGREDDVYNLGGSKGYFQDVESTLQTHPAVREAVAFVLSRPTGQDQLVAAVITAAPATESDLLAWSAQRLGPVHPEKIFFVSTFERTVTGKVLRARLSLSFSIQAS